MQTLYKINFLILIMLFIVNAHGSVLDNIVRIEEMSSSGKTIYIDKGSTEGILENEFGILVKKILLDNDEKSTIFKPVAKIRAIKAYDHYSVWLIYKTYIPNEIVKKSELFLFSESKLLKGRTDLTYKRTKLITKEGRVQEVKDFLLEGDELAKKNQDYKIISKAHSKEKHFDKDIDLIDIDQWEEGTDDKYFANGIYRSPYAKDFSKRKRVHTFEKMVVAFLNKYNDPNFNFNETYNLGVNNKPKSIINRSIYQSYIDQYEQFVQNKIDKEEKFLMDYRKKGDAWSESYSDSELSEMLNNLSIVRERERRRTLVTSSFENVFYFSMGLNLLDNENLNDNETTESNKYDFELGYEHFPFKLSRKLKDFTFQYSFRRAQDAYFGGLLNVRQTEYSFAGHLNWYPYYKPTVINANILYFGIYTRFGLATASNDSTDEKGNYQLFTLPGFRTGIKYNFDNSFGLRMTASYENIRTERLVRSSDSGTLPDRTFYREGKISFGISRFY